MTHRRLAVDGTDREERGGRGRGGGWGVVGGPGERGGEAGGGRGVGGRGCRKEKQTQSARICPMSACMQIQGYL